MSFYEYGLPIIFIILILGIFFIIFFLSFLNKIDRSFESLFNNLVQKRGGNFKKGLFRPHRYSFTYKDTNVDVLATSGFGGSISIRVCIKGNFSKKTRIINKRSGIVATKFRGEKEILTGNVLFDDEYRILSGNENLTFSILTSDVQKQLLDLQNNKRFIIRLYPNMLETTLMGVGSINQFDLEKLIDLVITLLDRLKEMNYI